MKPHRNLSTWNRAPHPVPGKAHVLHKASPVEKVQLLQDLLLAEILCTVRVGQGENADIRGVVVGGN